MKKILLAVVAVLLLSIGAYFSLQKEKEKTTVIQEDSNFSIADTSQITRFFIAQKNGVNHHFIKQSNTEWLVNNKWQAEKKMVDMVLGTIHEMRLKNPVPKSMKQSVIKELASKGTKVELYNAEGLIKTFFIGVATADSKGTFIIMEGSETPYVVYIPRHHGYITDRFTISRREFIDKAIFQSKAKNITKIQVDYPNDEASSILIEQNNNRLEIANLSGTLDSLKFIKYVQLYEKIHAEQLVKVIDRKGLDDSLATVIPFAKITIEDNNPVISNSVTLYDMGDPDRMLGLVEKNNVYVFCQYYNFQHLLVKREYFKKIELNL